MKSVKVVIMGKNNVLNPASPPSLQQLDCIRMISFIPDFVLNDICLLSLVIRIDLSSVLKRIWYSPFTFAPPSPAYPSFFTVWTDSFYFHPQLHFYSYLSLTHFKSWDVQSSTAYEPQISSPSISFFLSHLLHSKSSSPCLFKIN